MTDGRTAAGLNNRGDTRTARYDWAVRNIEQAAVAERLRQTFDLFEAGLSMTRARLRRESPDADEQEIERQLRAWLAQRPGAEYGDAPGRPRQLNTESA